mgnify:CR=1 FL=1
MIKHVVFMYPSRNLGGAQLLFARLARYLAEEDVLDVTVVDYHDGFIRRQLEGVVNVNFINYYPGVTLPADSVTITALTNLAYLRFMVSAKSLKGDFLLWSLHPKNIEHVINSHFRRLFQLRRKKIFKELVELAESGCIVFMDGCNKFSFEKVLGTKVIAENYLPIPIPIPLPLERSLGSRIQTMGPEISIAWLGRISFDKVSAIKKIIEDISLSNYRHNVTFHVVGDGPEMGSVLKYINKKNVKLNHVGTLKQPALDQFLINQVDFGISMGTSSLEFAKLKIPVALVDYSLSKIPRSHGYIWLNDTVNFTLGNDVTWGFSRKMSFDDLVLELSEDMINDVGSRCFDYVLNNHTLNSVSKKLLEALDIKAKANRFKVTHVESLISPYLFALAFRTLRNIKCRLTSMLKTKNEG